MLLARLLYRLVLLGAALGLWSQPDGRAAPLWEPALGARCCGAALVQGRRFAQEDRAVVLQACAPSGGNCSSLRGNCSGALPRAGQREDARMIYAGAHEGEWAPLAWGRCPARACGPPGCWAVQRAHAAPTQRMRSPSSHACTCPCTHPWDAPPMQLFLMDMRASGHLTT